MTARDEIAIKEVATGERARLVKILEESFDGWYLMHSRRTLMDAEVVRTAVSSGADIGLVMLDLLSTSIGYVFYIAVAKAHRRRGVARMLLDDALRYFKGAGMKEVYASVEEGNLPSEKLFESEGFAKVSFGDVSRAYGSLQALNMYRKMRVVPGEILLRKDVV